MSQAAPRILGAPATRSFDDESVHDAPDIREPASTDYRPRRSQAGIIHEQFTDLREVGSERVHVPCRVQDPITAASLVDGAASSRAVAVPGSLPTFSSIGTNGEYPRVATPMSSHHAGLRTPGPRVFNPQSRPSKLIRNSRHPATSNRPQTSKVPSPPVPAITAKPWCPLLNGSEALFLNAGRAMNVFTKSSQPRPNDLDGLPLV